jgi:hypothetical protein
MPVDTVREAIATMPATRWVMSRGRIVAGETQRSRSSIVAGTRAS